MHIEILCFSSTVDHICPFSNWSQQIHTDIFTQLQSDEQCQALSVERMTIYSMLYFFLHIFGFGDSLKLPSSISFLYDFNIICSSLSTLDSTMPQKSLKVRSNSVAHMSISINRGKVEKKSSFLQASEQSLRMERMEVARIISSAMTLKVMELTLSVELYPDPGVTTHMMLYRVLTVGVVSANNRTGILRQFHSEYTLKNYTNSFAGLWQGKIWHTFATKIAHDIPPKYPIPLELIPLFLAHTFTTLNVSLKFSFCLPVNSTIIRLFFLPNNDILLCSSLIDAISSLEMTFSMSLGTVSLDNWQKLISMSISLYQNVMMGTLALVLTVRLCTLSSDSNLSAKTLKKWYSLLMKLGQTHMRSMSLLLDWRSRTQLPKGSSLAMYSSISFSLIFISVVAISLLHLSTTSLRNCMTSLLRAF